MGEFDTTAQGCRLAISVGGVLTGRGADLIVIDDPSKPEEALSGIQRWAANQWYDQTEGEWAVLLAGAARLRFADETAPRLLCPGDVLDIAPHRRHRVEWTDPQTPTVWLAVFYS